MASQPSDIRFTPRDIRYSGQIADALWILSVAMLALLAAWSTGPHWPA